MLNNSYFGSTLYSKIEVQRSKAWSVFITWRLWPRIIHQIFWLISRLVPQKYERSKSIFRAHWYQTTLLFFRLYGVFLILRNQVRNQQLSEGCFWLRQNSGHLNDQMNGHLSQHILDNPLHAAILLRSSQ